MATVFDVAQYVLEKCGSMSAMKLQKLVYYSQAWSLVWDGVPLFNEEFEAWANGPVCKELYLKHRGSFIVDSNLLIEEANIENLNQDAKDTIDVIVKDYCQFAPHELSAMTHRENPWLDSRAGVAEGERSTNIITKDSMGIYYGEL